MSDAPVVISGDAVPLAGEGEPRVAALQRAVAGLRLRATRGGVDRWLFIAGSILAPLGLLLVLLGWYGAAHTPYQFEQLPYVISGGLLGLALAVLGGLAYFAYWLTRLTASQREQTDRIVAALERLHDAGGAAANGNGRAVAGATARRSTSTATATAAGSAVGLVATSTGTMVHRPDCVVVANRPKLRKVKAGAAGFSPCKLCDPYGETADEVAGTIGGR